MLSIWHIIYANIWQARIPNWHVCMTRYAKLDKSLIVQKIKLFCQSYAKFVSLIQKGHVITVSIIFNEFYVIFNFKIIKLLSTF